MAGIGDIAADHDQPPDVDTAVSKALSQLGDEFDDAMTVREVVQKFAAIGEVNQYSPQAGVGVPGSRSAVGRTHDSII